jgi:hypothetical protein
MPSPDAWSGRRQESGTPPCESGHPLAHPKPPAPAHPNPMPDAGAGQPHDAAVLQLPDRTATDTATGMNPDDIQRPLVRSVKDRSFTSER